MRRVRVYQLGVIAGLLLLLEALCLAGVIDKLTMQPPHRIAVIFGLGDGPQVLIGFLLGVVAVIVTTLNGLDRVPHVLRKTALICGMGPFDTAVHVTLPFCSPYLLTAAKLALAYAFIGVIGSEFIMARSGMGYEIGYAYTNFDNATMYPLILLILLLSIVLNGILTHWEKVLLARRGQH